MRRPLEYQPGEIGSGLERERDESSHQPLNSNPTLRIRTFFRTFEEFIILV